MCWNKGRLYWKIAKLFYFCHLKKLVRPETFGPTLVCVVFPWGLPHSGFHVKILYKFFFFVFHATQLHIVSSMTWSPVQYLVWIKNHESSWYVILTRTPFTSFILGPDMFLITLLLNTLIVCPLVMWRMEFHTHIWNDRRNYICSYLPFAFFG